MSYLQDKKAKRKNFLKIATGILLLIILFYFRSGIWKGLSYASEEAFHPVLVLGRGIGEKFGSVGSYFASKNSLFEQNKKLLEQLKEEDARMANYDSVVADDTSLKEILGRKDAKATMILAVILAKPNQSPYDTLLIDAGSAQGIKAGGAVFAFGDIPIGRVGDVYPSSSKVILFSSPGETTQVAISSSSASPADSSGGSTAPVSGGNIFADIVGRGGGNFEMVMPKDFTLEPGRQVVLPGINSHVLAIVQKIISDPRNPFTKALLSSPVNVEQLKFVEVEQ
jgi:cell shape-determining protein MreC